MTTIVEIPGVGEVEFPTSMSQDQIMTAIQGMNQPANPLDVGMIDPTGLIGSTKQVATGIGQGIDRAMQALQGSAAGQETAQDPQSALNTLSQSASASLLDAGLNFAGMGPGILGKGAAAAEAGVRTLGQAPFSDQSMGELFGQNLQQANQRNPALALQSFPTALDAPAAIQTAFGGGNFEDNRNRLQEHFFVSREQNPGMADIGDVVGDALALTLTFGRPTKAIIERGAAPIKSAINNMSPGIRSFLDDIVKQKNLLGTLGVPPVRGTLRAAEAGLEGALLGILTEGDPRQLAMWSAGLQAGGSMARGVTGIGAFLEGDKKRGLSILAANAAATWAALQYVEAPLTDNPLDPLNNVQSVTDKIFLIAPLAIAASVGGAGRPTQALNKQFGEFANDLFRVRRGAVMSMVEQSQRDARIEPVVKRLMMQPDFFTPAEQRRLERAWQGDTKMGKVLDDLSSDRKFVRKLNEIMGL